MQPEGVNVPAFLNKLWNMVNEPYTDHLICWSEDGKSFIIQNQAQFWYDLLPQYYKHNNMSSFVRQLNMYGFHKKSSADNPSMDNDKDEIQFYHPYFQKGRQELMKNIKRKVTGSTRISSEPIQQVNWKQEDLSKVLADVKNLKGKQASVDTQLMAMKHENAVLWRELAVLRQKHMTQQKIVNKLIQFLVTIVQPTRMGGLGVKRHYQLMLNDASEAKKKKGNSSASDGPTIHELDSTIHHDDVFIENLQSPENVTVSSPAASHMSASSPVNCRTMLEEPVADPIPPNVLLENIELEPSSVENEENLMNPTEFIDMQDMNQVNFEKALGSRIEKIPRVLRRSKNRPNIWLFRDMINAALASDDSSTGSSDSEEEQYPDNDLLRCDVNIDENLSDTLPVDVMENNTENVEDQKVFLNPNAQNKLLSNLMTGNYNSALISGATSGKSPVVVKKEPKEEATKKPKPKGKDLAVATRDPLSADDLDLHLESTQSELEQLKDLLNGCNTFDANALLGLFSDDTFPYELSYSQENENNPKSDGGEMVSGSELAPLTGSDMIDFSQLLDDSSEMPENSSNEFLLGDNPDLDILNTPQISLNTVPTFPTTATSKAKTRKSK